MDPIADILTQIRNGLAVNKDKVEVNYSKINERIAKLLEKEGFVDEVHPFKEGGKAYKRLSIKFLYGENGDPKITELKRVSKPGRRVYKRKKDLKKILGGRGVGIISTPRGIMTVKEAKRRGLGGELICEVW